MDIISFMILLILFIFIFALLGMEFFAQRVRFDEDTGLVVPYKELQERYNTDPYSLVALRNNFDSISRALTSVFVIAMEDDWQWQIVNHVIPFDRKYSLFIIFWFILCICIISQTLLSLFTAIIIEKFDTSEEH
jgi:voltage-dependent calcium channel L type alpha-1D